MGGLTPLQISEGWTLPQVAILVLKIAENEGKRDPFKPGPGERVRGK